MNKDKTQITHMRDINYLGFSFRRSNGKCQFYLHKETLKKLKSQIRELTSRSNGWVMTIVNYVFTDTFVVGRTILDLHVTRIN